MKKKMKKERTDKQTYRSTITKLTAEIIVFFFWWWGGEEMKVVHKMGETVIEFKMRKGNSN